MKIRPDLLDKNSPPGLEVIQLHDKANLPSGHVYPHAEVFTPDSRLFLLDCDLENRDLGPCEHQHRWCLCDIESNCELIPLEIEPGAKVGCISPDGRYIYYFTCDRHIEKGPLRLKRMNLDGSEPTLVATVDGPLPGSNARLVHPKSTPTMSSDGARLAQAMIMSNQSRGVVVFDLTRGTAQLILDEAGWSNTHLQYCRSKDAEESHDLMIQHCHAKHVAEPPGTHQLQDVDIHVIRDDGSNLRTLPWGRDGQEYCMGHQCWRGRSSWAITSTITHLPTPENPGRTECQLIESKAVPDEGHIGRNHRYGLRNELTREFDNPQFYHFATDIGGDLLLCDYWHPDGHQKHAEGRQLLYLGFLSTPGIAPAKKFTYLLNTGAASARATHAHPFLSPDGKYGFFNSDESGTPQAYMIRNLPKA